MRSELSMSHKHAGQGGGPGEQARCELRCCLPVSAQGGGRQPLVRAGGPGQQRSHWSSGTETRHCWQMAAVCPL